VHQGSPGNAFGFTGAGKLYGLNTSRTAIFQSTNTGINNPPWTQVGSSAGRIIAHGNKLYATGGSTF
jgi:hypothetical protein